MASHCLIPPLPSFPSSKLKSDGRKQVRKISISCCTSNNCQATSLFPNPFSDERIFKKAFKEPVAFLGGVFAGVLRLDLNEDPLREWVARTVEASGITTDEEELDVESDTTPQPQPIEIQ